MPVALAFDPAIMLTDTCSTDKASIYATSYSEVHLCLAAECQNPICDGMSVKSRHALRGYVGNNDTDHSGELIISPLVAFESGRLIITSSLKK